MPYNLRDVLMTRITYTSAKTLQVLGVFRPRLFFAIPLNVNFRMYKLQYIVTFNMFLIDIMIYKRYM